ncbi:DNA translocase FtsK [Patescibacteria group bacterium]|nr:DNA translocase FtsK [Patescibacteria group bacterium]
MKKKLKKKEAEIETESFFSKIKDETLQGVMTIIFFVLGIFLILASMDYGGLAGEKVYSLFSLLFGVGYFLLPVLLFIIAYSNTLELRSKMASTKTVGSLIFFLSGLGIVSILFPDKGGIFGGAIASPLLKLFDIYASLIFLTALLIISLLVIFDTELNFKKLMFWKNRSEGEDFDDEIQEEKEFKITGVTETEKDDSPALEKIPQQKVLTKKEKEEEDFEKDVSMTGGFLSRKALEYFGKRTLLPPISLLNKDKGKPEVGDIKANSNIIKRTLKNFGINVEMDEISIGPSVTRYALKPAEGIKLARIVGLQNDLSLALAAHPLRIEAPIPGKSLVGIEIPNKTKTMVGLGSLFNQKEFQQSDKLLTIALGKDISGKAHFVNLAKAPHMLIAGATGAGKSVTIHALITSLLYKATPDNLKFIMIDPKRVELTQYKNIPHQLTPVITDAKKAILALKWAIKEMDRRYDILESHSVRDIQSYHKNIVAPAYEKALKQKQDIDVELPDAMPYIVIVIDELADIMQTYPRELEAAIVRLAQMSRAIGIHLVLSTQRPSVNVITGLIKANVPTRVALQVASQVDSRTILDMSGAEKLLGAGDMLYMSGDMSKPTRIQSAFISEPELKAVTKFLRESYKDEIPHEIDISSAEKDRNPLFDALNDTNEDSDDLFDEAREAVIEAGKASTSYLQRKLRVGYARAARIMDELEEAGMIGPADGSKPREVLVGNETEEEPSTEDNEIIENNEEESGYLVEDKEQEINRNHE